MKKIIDFITSHIINFVKGIAIGIAVMIPGVSGGTIAVVVGIYDKLIRSVSSFFKSIKENALFLAVVGFGGIGGVLLFTFAFTSLYESAKFEFIFLFLGLIIGSMPILFKNVNLKETSPLNFLWLLPGIALVVSLMFVKTSVTSNITPLLMFFAGLVASVAFIVPGISGSFFMLMIGLYEITLNDLINFEFSLILPFLAGAVIGVILTAKVIEWLLKKYKNATYLVIIGFVAGSAISLLVDYIPHGIHILYSAIAFVAGVGIAALLNKISKRFESPSENQP
jgi:putative membrane protein